MSSQGSAGNVLSAFASLLVPGLGQLLQGRLLIAAFMFLTAVALYGISPFLLLIPIIPAALIHLWSVLDAARYRSSGD
jgi:hypothetical protein